MITGDHAYLDPCGTCFDDRGLDFGSRWIDNADQGQHGQVSYLGKQIARWGEARRVDITTPDRHHAQSLPAQSLVVRRVLTAYRLYRNTLLLGIPPERRAGQQLVGSSLHEAADDLAPSLILHFVER